MDGYCWIHEHGKFCFQGSSFQSVTKVDSEIYYETFIKGKKYSYSETNVAKVKKEYASIPTTQVGGKKMEFAISELGETLDTLQNVKRDCRVEEAADMTFDPKDIRIISSHKDGSSIHKFHDMVIFVDRTNVPISIQSPSETKKGEYEVIAAITHVKKIGNDDFVICDPHGDIGNDDVPKSLSPDDGKRRLLNVMDAHDPSLSEEEYFAKVEDRHRKLGWLEDFSNWASNTNVSCIVKCNAIAHAKTSTIIITLIIFCSSQLTMPVII